MARKRLWAREHPAPLERTRQRRRKQTAQVKAVGAAANAAEAHSIAWDGRAGPELQWMVRVAIPFSYAASKNHIYALRAAGHVALRKESSAFRDSITLALVVSLAGQRVAHNKVWLDILVQKPNHKGDAVNVVDLVCDGVKRAIPVDDRWFCIRRLDWEIVRDSPRLFIGVGQEAVEDAQVCSCCGQIKPFAAFGRRKHGHHGVSRECFQCRRKS